MPQAPWPSTLINQSIASSPNYATHQATTSPFSPAANGSFSQEPSGQHFLQDHHQGFEYSNTPQNQFAQSHLSGAAQQSSYSSTGGMMLSQETYMAHPTYGIPPAYDIHTPSSSCGDYEDSVVQGVHAAAVPKGDQIPGPPDPLAPTVSQTAHETSPPSSSPGLVPQGVNTIPAAAHGLSTLQTARLTNVTPDNQVAIPQVTHASPQVAHAGIPSVTPTTNPRRTLTSLTSAIGQMACLPSESQMSQNRVASAVSTTRGAYNSPVPRTASAPGTPAMNSMPTSQGASAAGMSPAGSASGFHGYHDLPEGSQVFDMAPAAFQALTPVGTAPVLAVEDSAGPARDLYTVPGALLAHDSMQFSDHSQLACHPYPSPTSSGEGYPPLGQPPPIPPISHHQHMGTPVHGHLQGSHCVHGFPSQEFGGYMEVPVRPSLLITVSEINVTDRINRMMVTFPVPPVMRGLQGPSVFL